MAGLAASKSNSALLQPDQCCLLFIDFTDLRSSTHANGSARDKLLNKAAELSVPVFLSWMDKEGADHPDSWLGRLVPDSVVLRRPLINPWKDSRLRETISEQKRHCLILAGGWLEGSLAQSALGALGEAYDVYVLFDLSSGLLDVQNSPVAARLIQAGVVPLTASQLILEWGDSYAPDPSSKE